MKDLTGTIFGKLTAMKRARPALRSGKRKRATWICLCECGDLCVVRTDQLLSGRRTSCGHKRGASTQRDGWTEEQYKEARDKQKDLCAICHKPERVEGQNLAKDHDHETGKPRELLCFRCNVALGFFGDDIDALCEAVKYLQKHK